MSASKRKLASRHLGLELQKRYGALVTAGNDPDDVQTAAILLGALFNENIEFIINILKEAGGIDVKWDPPRRTTEINDNLPETPSILLN